MLRLTEVEPDKAQPRKHFDDAALGELADSIAEHGVLQPIVVRQIPGGSYKIVAGERRWRAARLAGLDQIPVLIKDISEQQAMELALIENLQREDLDPVEEAAGYRQLKMCIRDSTEHDFKTELPANEIEIFKGQPKG